MQAAFYNARPELASFTRAAALRKALLPLLLPSLPRGRPTWSASCLVGGQMVQRHAVHPLCDVGKTARLCQLATH